MDKVLGIIAEYNPFHNGHLYHLENSKKETGCNYSVAIISGNFTQRGLPSIINKWEKTRMALANGVDLVIELPVLYSISSAENFADGAIKILNSLGIIDYISFGAETSNISILDKFADVLYNEPDQYKSILKNELKKGLSFPKARENALLQYINNSETNNTNYLTSPNNILGIEYLKALKKYNSAIKPFSITRYGPGFNVISYSDNIASSTCIRNLLFTKNFDIIKKVIPNNCFKILEENFLNGNVVEDLSFFEREILYILRKMSIQDISELPDVSEGLEFAIKKSANSCNKIYDLIDNLKSKRYTITRIQRILLYALLGITKNDMDIAKSTNPYVRVLGFNENGKKIISDISKCNPNLNLITSVKKFVDSNSDRNLELLLNKDILSTNIYTLGCKGIFEGNLDFKTNILLETLL